PGEDLPTVEERERDSERRGERSDDRNEADDPTGFRAQSGPLRTMVRRHCPSKHTIVYWNGLEGWTRLAANFNQSAAAARPRNNRAIDGASEFNSTHPVANKSRKALGHSAKAVATGRLTPPPSARTMLLRRFDGGGSNKEP